MLSPIRCLPLLACVLLAGCSVLFDPTEAMNADLDAGAPLDGSLDGGPNVRGNILFEDDFEQGLNGWDVWTSTGATVSGTTLQQHGGSRAAHCVSAEDERAQAALHLELPGDPSVRSDIYVLTHIYLDAGFPPTAPVALLVLWHQDAYLAQLWIEPNGVLAFKNEQSQDFITGDYELPVGEWVPLEMRMNTNAGGGHISVRVGRTEVIDSPTPITEDSPVDAINTGVEWQSEDMKHYELFVDDVLVMDQLE